MTPDLLYWRFAVVVLSLVELRPGCSLLRVYATFFAVLILPYTAWVECEAPSPFMLCWTMVRLTVLAAAAVSSQLDEVSFVRGGREMYVLVLYALVIVERDLRLAGLIVLVSFVLTVFKMANNVR